MLKPSGPWSEHPPRMPELGTPLFTRHTAPSCSLAPTQAWPPLTGLWVAHGKPSRASRTLQQVGRGLTAKGIRAAERKDGQGASVGEAAPPFQPAPQAAADPAGQEQGQEKQHQEPEAEAAGKEQYHHHLRAAPTDGCMSSN